MRDTEAHNPLEVIVFCLDRCVRVTHSTLPEKLDAV